MQKALGRQFTLTHRDLEKRLCFYIDAPNEAWSAIVIQVPFEDVDREQKAHLHEPLGFLSGCFDGTQMR